MDRVKGIPMEFLCNIIAKSIEVRGSGSEVMHLVLQEVSCLVSNDGISS